MCAAGLPRCAQRLGPVVGGPRRGALGDVAEHGGRAGRAPAADRAQLHRGQVLRLVEHDVAEARLALDQVGGLVDEHRVGQRPRRGLRARGPASATAAAPARPGRGPRRRRGPAPPGRTAAPSPPAPGRPPARARSTAPAHRHAARHRVLDPVVGGLAGRLHLGEQRVRQPLREHRPGRAVADVAGAQLGDHLAQLVGRAPASGATRAAAPAARSARTRPACTARLQDRRHPRVALEHRERRRVDRSHLDPVRRPARRASPVARRPRRAPAAPPRCRTGRPCWVRRRARRRAAAGRGARRAGTPPGAGRPRSCRCRARPARRRVSVTSARTITSCSGWMVATMSRIGPTRGRSISPARMRLRALGLGPVQQVLVLVGRDHAALEAEPAAQPTPIGSVAGRPVERASRRRPASR